jgi:hypothetical protein
MSHKIIVGQSSSVAVSNTAPAKAAPDPVLVGLVKKAVQHQPQPLPDTLSHAEASWRTTVAQAKPMPNRQGYDAFPTLNSGKGRNGSFKAKPFPEVTQPGDKQYALHTEAERQVAIARKHGILTTKGTEESVNGIKFSQIPRYSLVSATTFNEDPATPQILRGKKFYSQTRIVHNSPLNGSVYWDPTKGKNGEFVTIKDAVSSSIDRYTDTVTLARQLTYDDDEIGAKETVCYAGRPDTKKKFKELAKMIFLGERDQRNLRQDANGVYQLRFVMNSVISTSSLVKDEYALITQEMAALKKFNGKTITIRDERGVKHRVKVDILFFSRQFNFLNPVERTFSTSYGYTGQQNSKDFSSPVQALEDLITPVQKQDLVNQELLRILKRNEQDNHLESIEEVFCRILLCQRANIPMAIHCRSSIDRTTIAAMLGFAIKAWAKSGGAIPARPYDLLDNPAFKELWYSSIPAGLALSPYSREEFGFKWQAGKWQVTQNPAALRLMPERHLEEFHLGTLKGTKQTIALCGFVALKSLKASYKSVGFLKTAAAVLYGIIQMAIVFGVGTALGVIVLLYEAYKSLVKWNRSHFHFLDNLGLGIQLNRALFKTIPKKVIKQGTQMFGAPGIEGKPLIYGGKVGSKAS